MTVRILCVGVLTRDIVLYVDRYPSEDESVRSVDRSIRIGGNATNNCQVIEQLQSLSTNALCIAPYLLASTCDQSTSADLITRSIARNEHASVLDAVKTTIFSNQSTSPLDGQSIPTSYIICSRVTGSRTIVHHRGPVPELTFEDFNKVPLIKHLNEHSIATSVDAAISQPSLVFDCIHWEGRTNMQAIAQMIERSVEQRAAHHTNSHRHTQAITQYPLLRRPLLTLEIEKPRPNIFALAAKIDCVFLSKDYCMSLYSSLHPNDKHPITGPVDFFRRVWPGLDDQNVPNKLFVVPWGDRGAAMFIQDTSSDRSSEQDLSQSIVSVPALKIDAVVDSVGAGDTFIGAFLFATLLSEPALSCNQSIKPSGSQAIKHICSAILTFACAIAGEKCAHVGVSGLPAARVRSHMIRLVSKLNAVSRPRAAL